MGPRHDAGEMRYDTMRCDAMADWHTRGNGFNADHDDRLGEAPGQCPHLRPCFADLGVEASSRPSTSLAPFPWVLHAKIGSDPAGISTVARDSNTAKTGRLVSQTRGHHTMHQANAAGVIGRPPLRGRSRRSKQRLGRPEASRAFHVARTPSGAVRW